MFQVRLFNVLENLKSYFKKKQNLKSTYHGFLPEISGAATVNCIEEVRTGKKKEPVFEFGSCELISK